MSSFNRTLGGANEWREVDNDTGAEVVANKAAATLVQHYITGITVSVDAAPDAAVLVQVLSDPDGTPVELDSFYLPAAAQSPVRINYLHPLPGGIGDDVEVTMPSPGSANGNVVMHGYSITRAG